MHCFLPSLPSISGRAFGLGDMRSVHLPSTSENTCLANMAVLEPGRKKTGEACMLSDEGKIATCRVREFTTAFSKETHSPSGLHLRQSCLKLELNLAPTSALMMRDLEEIEYLLMLLP